MATGCVQRLLVTATVLGGRVASRHMAIDAPPRRLQKLPIPSALQAARQVLSVFAAPAPLRRLALVALGIDVLIARAWGALIPIVLLVGVAVLTVAFASLVTRPVADVLGPCVTGPVAPLAVIVTGPVVHCVPV